MKTLVTKGLLNVVAGSGGNVDTDSTTGIKMIVADNSANPLVPIINMPFKKSQVAKVTKIVSAAEVRRQWLIAAASATEQAVVLSTKYTIGIDHVEAKTGSEKRGTKTPYSYTSPAVLSGNADTDRANLFTVLAAKINADYKNHGEAKLVSAITCVAAGDMDDVAIGGKIFQTDTNYAAADWEATIVGWNAAGTEYLVIDQIGTLNAATVDSLYVNTVSPNAVSTDLEAVENAAQGIYFIDDAGYWVTPEDSRAGASIVTLEAGFSSIVPCDIIVDRVYAQGIGSEMLLHTPAYVKSKEDIVSGDMEYTFNALPVIGSTYTLVIIDLEKNNENVAGFGHANTQKIQMHLYCKESSGSVDDLITALTA